MAKTAYMINNVNNSERYVRSTLKEVSAVVGYQITGKNLHQQPHISVVLVDDLGNVVDETGMVLAEVVDGLVVNVVDESATVGTEATEEEVAAATEAAIAEETLVDPDEHAVDVEEGSDPVEDDTEPTPPPAPKWANMGDNKPSQSKVLTNTKAPKAPNANEPIEYPEKGAFTDEKAMKKYIKKLTDEQLIEWCELEGVTWKRCLDNPSIDRMRAAMGIKAFHGFGAAQAAGTGKKKGKGKYSSISTEELVKLALHHEVDVKDDKGDERILRMYAIMALREHGILDSEGNILKPVTA